MAGNLTTLYCFMTPAFITARCYAERGYATAVVRPSDCLSVCP